MTLGTCDQPGCKVAQSGLCMEGIDLSGWNKCQHFTPSADSVDDSASDEDASEEEIDADIEDEEQTPPVPTAVLMHSLSDGEELDMQGASEVMRAAPTRLIILAGDTDIGKSTLLACLNQCFQRGPYAGYLFARSRTLVAFERICHESRLASKRSIPDTARTMLGFGPRFLHLAVRREEGSTPPRHLLLSNLPGEDFERVRNFKDEALKMNFIHQADFFVLVLDGSQLAQPQVRAKTRTRAQQILRRLVEVGILGQHSQVDVLISKWDCLEDALSIAEDAPAEVQEERKALREFLGDTESLFRTAFESQLGRLRFFNIAARPDLSSDLPDAYGLEQVFRTWVEDALPVRSPDSVSEVAPTSPSRESMRFVWRPSNSVAP